MLQCAQWCDVIPTHFPQPLLSHWRNPVSGFCCSRGCDSWECSHRSEPQPQESTCGLPLLPDLHTRSNLLNSYIICCSGIPLKPPTLGCSSSRTRSPAFQLWRLIVVFALFKLKPFVHAETQAICHMVHSFISSCRLCHIENWRLYQTLWVTCHIFRYEVCKIVKWGEVETCYLLLTWPERPLFPVHSLLLFLYNLYLTRKVPLIFKTSFSMEFWPRGNKSYTELWYDWSQYCHVLGFGRRQECIK